MKKADRIKAWIQILDLLRTGPMTYTEVAAHLYKRTDFAFQQQAESLCDEMWSLGYCTNMGHYHDYKYRITQKGEQYLGQADRPA